MKGFNATALTGSSWLEDALASLKHVQIAVFGDFCLDAYWDLDKEESELSVETGLQVRRVRTQRYSLGGAGNVVANLADLGVKKVKAIGVVGADAFGGELLRLLEAKGVDTGNGRQSIQIGRPWSMPNLTQGSRRKSIDFGAFNSLSGKTADSLIEALEQAYAVAKL